MWPILYAISWGDKISNTSNTEDERLIFLNFHGKLKKFCK